MARPATKELVPAKDAFKAVKAKALAAAGQGKGPHQEEWDRCRADFAHFCSTHVETYDPRRTPSHVPFALYPFQMDVARKLQKCEAEKRSVVIVKSRDMGMSWLLAAYAVWCWLTKPPGDKTTLSSYKESRVDEMGNPDSIMEKCRMVIRRLPLWMLPYGYSEEKCLKRLNFVNPENGNSVTGEFGKNTGRAGRCTRLFLDEYAFYEELKAVDASVSAASDFRVYLSTPFGPNTFADKFYSDQYENIVLNWDLHPNRDRDWLEAKRKELEPHVFAQEYCCDFTASVDGVCIPGEWVRAAVGFVHPGEKDSDACARAPVCVGLDVGASSAKTTVAAVRKGYRVLEMFASSGRDTTVTARQVLALCKKKNAAQLNYDGSGIGVSIGSALAHMDTPFRCVPVMGGASPGVRYWEDGRTSRQRFLNRRAEDWYRLRCRFERTWEVATGRNTAHPPEECVSIPNNQALVAQLSMPVWKQTVGGKTKVESKEEMRSRGIASPDLADAVVYAFAEEPVRPGAKRKTKLFGV